MPWVVAVPGGRGWGRAALPEPPPGSGSPAIFVPTSEACAVGQGGVGQSPVRWSRARRGGGLLLPPRPQLGEGGGASPLFTENRRSVTDRYQLTGEDGANGLRRGQEGTRWGLPLERFPCLWPAPGCWLPHTPEHAGLQASTCDLSFSLPWRLRAVLVAHNVVEQMTDDR